MLDVTWMLVTKYAENATEHDEVEEEDRWWEMLREEKRRFAHRGDKNKPNQKLISNGGSGGAATDGSSSAVTVSVKKSQWVRGETFPTAADLAMRSWFASGGGKFQKLDLGTSKPAGEPCHADYEHGS
jgi:hypothetical protein